MAFFHIADRQLAALHAIQEVSDVIASGCGNFHGLHGRLSVLFIAGPDLRSYLEPAPGQYHAAFGAVKFQQRLQAAVTVRIPDGFKPADLAACPSNGATGKTVDDVLNVRRFSAVL